MIFINYIKKQNILSKTIPVISLCFLTALLTLPGLARKSVVNAINLCTMTVIPSLFPFMVVNNLLIFSGFEDMIPKFIKVAFEKLFHLNSNLCAAYIIGMMSGYPQGASAILSIYEKGKCTENEAERALTFCNNTGPAFLIGAIGGLFSSVRLGIFLYILQFIVSSLYAIITRPKKIFIAPEVRSKKNDIYKNQFVRAVKSSIKPMAAVCAFVIIFAVISAFAQSICQIFDIPEPVCNLIYSLLEISNAAFILSKSTYPISLAFLGFAVCWSGFSVHMQTSAILSDVISMKRYYKAKLIQGISAFCIIIFIITACKYFSFELYL